MKIVVLISANAEWRTVKEILSPPNPQTTPLGEYFDWPLITRHSSLVTFFHGGWGKISAAATTQYAIDHFAPDLLVNLGTCGGFAGRIETGTIILVEKTIVYDIIEQMGDADEAIAHYSTDIDLSWLADNYAQTVLRGLLVSADRDIVVTDIPMLVEKYGAVAADWESGAIAWVAQRNGVRCLILRGVTDLVSGESGANCQFALPVGGEAYGNIGLFHERTKTVMENLIAQLPDWLAAIRA